MAIQINNATPLTTNPGQSASAQKPATAEVKSVPVSGTLPDQEASTVSQEEKIELEVAVSNINDYVQNIKRSIHFSVSESSGRTIIEVYDAETDELIRSIPSEEVQRISEAIEERLSEGLLVKTNV